MRVEIRQAEFDPWEEIRQFESDPALRSGSFGACTSFVGTMRDFNQGSSVSSMVLEYYPGMTERLLEDFARQMQTKHELLELLVVHRVGKIRPADSIVLVAAWSGHRKAAFDGCREMMEHLKSNATFWKKEKMTDSVDGSAERWVDNLSG